MNNLHPDILRNIEESNKKGGIQLEKLAVGTRVEAQTLNTLYKIKALGNNKYEVHGGSRFPEPVETTIGGSTWGGSMIKIGWLGIDMHMEVYSPFRGNVMVSTAIRSLKIIAPDNSWEYKMGI